MATHPRIRTRLSLSKPLGAALVFALAACSGHEPSPQATGEPIACAINGSAELKPLCAVERSETGGRLTLTVHHPDGAFRRFTVLTDGRGLEVADGAQVAVTRLDGDRLDVSVGADRYLFPATRKSHAPQSEPAR